MNKKRQLSVPFVHREYLVLYLTEFDNVLNLECITADEITETLNLIKDIDELELEQILIRKDVPSFIEKKPSRYENLTERFPTDRNMSINTAVKFAENISAKNTMPK